MVELVSLLCRGIVDGILVMILMVTEEARPQTNVTCLTDNLGVLLKSDRNCTLNSGLFHAQVVILACTMRLPTAHKWPSESRAPSKLSVSRMDFRGVTRRNCSGCW